VLGVVVLFGLYGLSKGLVRGALSLAGFALGAYAGARLAPSVLEDGSPYVPLVALGGAVLGGTLLSSLAGLLGVTLRSTMGVVPGLRALDSVAGLLLGAAAGVVLSWAVGAVLLYLPGQAELRRAVQDSAILSRINESFPPERLLETLERVDPLGVLVGPPATVPPPKAAIARDPDVASAAGSVVRISGIACGLGIEGSGWIAGRGVVVTNAHVVAGIVRPEERSRRAAREGSEWPAASACGARERRAGCDSRVSGERAADAHAGPPRRDGRLHQQGRVRARACAEVGDGDSRRRSAWELGRPRSRRAGSSADDHLRAQAGRPRRLRRPARPGPERSRSRRGWRRGSRDRLRRLKARATQASPLREQLQRSKRLPEGRDEVNTGGALA
jgi:Colicin V production protein